MDEVVLRLLNDCFPTNFPALPKSSDENQYLSITVIHIPAPVLTDKSCHFGREKKELWSAAKIKHTKCSVLPL